MQYGKKICHSHHLAGCENDLSQNWMELRTMHLAMYLPDNSDTPRFTFTLIIF